MHPWQNGVGMGWVLELPTPTAGSQPGGLPLCPLSHIVCGDPGGSDLRELTVPPRMCALGPLQGLPRGQLPYWGPILFTARLGYSAGPGWQAGGPRTMTSPSRRAGQACAGAPHALTPPIHKQGLRVAGGLIL